MHSALFVAHVPKDKAVWNQFATFVAAQHKHQKGIVGLSDNVWLVNFHQSPSGLAWLIAYAEDRNISYGVLQFEKPPEWLPVGFDPASIRE